MEDDWFYVDDDKYFNLHKVINFYMIVGLILLKSMGGITVEIGRTWDKLQAIPPSKLIKLIIFSKYIRKDIKYPPFTLFTGG